MLTLCYASTTFLQAWRIKNVCTKIAEKLAQHGSIAFYTLTDDEDGFDPSLATSDLCINRSVATVSDILWMRGTQRGCSLLPRQIVHIPPWISFPDAPSWLPFEYNISTQDSTLFHKNKEQIFLLLETNIYPCRHEVNSDIIKVEDYGKLLAWRIDSHLALLIETDLERFTQFLVTTFLQNNMFINDRLSLLRIESINYEGEPQPYPLVANHLRKSTRCTAALNEVEWKKHLECLHALSILANQAIEFEYNKNRTEGKTGVVKPDLILHAKKETTIVDKTVKTESITTPQLLPKPKDSTDDVVLTIPAQEMATDTNSKFINYESSVNVALKPKKTVGTLKTKPTDIKRPSAATLSSTNTDKEKTTECEPESVSTLPQRKLASETNANNLKDLSAIASSVQEKSSPHKKIDDKHRVEMESILQSEISGSKPAVNNTVASTMKAGKDNLHKSKPLNVLVYSDSNIAYESAVNTLKYIMENDIYTIKKLSPNEVEPKYWFEYAALLVVCGAVDSTIGKILVDFFLQGGKLLSLCSDILHLVLPTYRTAEVRENELAQFSYGKWQKVIMMHHIFCYQPSPVKKNFSTDSDDSTPAHSGKSALVCPRSVELKDLRGDMHNLDVDVLATEEVWNTPSLLMVRNPATGGKAVFSQVHLETNPSQFETDGAKYSALQQNEKMRLDIFSDLLDKHLDVSVKINMSIANISPKSKCIYRSAYFLGHHESKFQLLTKLKATSGAVNILKTSKLTMQFCGENEKTTATGSSVLPILIHSCPDDFSTVEYFDKLKTSHIGRLVIYVPIVNSSMNIISELELTHGLAVLVRQQTEGMGRGNNQWLSPLGCAMFSFQLHVPLNTSLGSRIPLLQHMVAAAMANALKSHDIYKILDIGLKWPNDIYANGVNKIGGIIVKTTISDGKAIINFGCAINLDNANPTVCINDLVREYNRLNNKSLPLLKYEPFIAMIFNEIEKLIDEAQVTNFDNFYKLYYDLWLHSDQMVTISDEEGKKMEGQITGIDDYGFLKAKLSNGLEKSLHPDGNNFDMLKGLIVPKIIA